MFEITTERKYSKRWENSGTESRKTKDYKYAGLCIGEKLAIFDNLLEPTLKDFQEIFNIVVTGDLTLPIEIMEQQKVDYMRRVVIDDKHEKVISLYPVDLTPDVVRKPRIEKQTNLVYRIKDTEEGTISLYYKLNNLCDDYSFNKASVANAITRCAMFFNRYAISRVELSAIQEEHQKFGVVDA